MSPPTDINSSRRPNHYLGRGGLQPQHLIEAFKLSFNEGCIIKYVTRWRKAGSLRDLRKARQYLDWLIMEAEGHPYIEPTEEDQARAKEVYSLPPDPADEAIEKSDGNIYKAMYPSEQERTFTPLALPKFVPHDSPRDPTPIPPTSYIWPAIVRDNPRRYEWKPYADLGIEHHVKYGQPAGWHLIPEGAPIKPLVEDRGAFDVVTDQPERLIPRYADPESGYRREPNEPEADGPADDHNRSGMPDLTGVRHETRAWVPYNAPDQRFDPGPEVWQAYGVKEVDYFWCPAGSPNSPEAGWARNAGREANHADGMPDLTGVRWNGP